MNLPPRLNELIARDNAMHAVVLKALAQIEPWTLDNKTIFFYEYTDHSLKHLAEVLLTAEGLMSDESWAQLSPQDGALIVLSVLLHDCALHLSEDGFYSLINGTYTAGSSRYVSNEPTWPSLWNEFIAEARRFDQRKLYQLFGDTEPVKTLPATKLALTLRHRLLIGEFLRRHHARLAHEIALSGIPGAGGTLSIADIEMRDFLDLAGFVARSHNLSIRTAVESLEPTQRRVHHNCKVPFVMMVLRIADYIQIHSSRAPGQLLRLKSLASPISRGEWKKHASVREINQAHDDPEAIFVDCEPETASTFLSMQLLLRDIQSELDKSWAVLGEIYGRFAPLNSLGITIRRVRSNLDNPENFRRTRRPTFLPREFRFQTASAELLDLLVAPLYGNRPEIGVRELVQNAVDACLERDDLITKGQIAAEVKPTEDVIVTLTQLENSRGLIVIEDFGVGMTPDVVSKYFLNVGASFRSSDVWRKNHEVEGHSTVLRTGRFGIGLLAAFLLGPEIKVTTRSIAGTPDSAITFTCRQGNESIEVNTTTFHNGTRVEIEVSDEVLKALTKDYEDWDWYCLANPKVRRIVSTSHKFELSQRYNVPECESQIDSTKWRRISAEGYDDVIWSYEALTRWRATDSVVICNGIYISNYSGIVPKISSKLGIIGASTPSLVVFDPDGRFPINLQRERVANGKTGFERALALDVAEYFVTHLIGTFEHQCPGINAENVQLSLQPNVPGLSHRGHASEGLGFLILTKDGVIPADADLMREAGITSIFIDATNIAAGRGAFKSAAVQAWADFYIAKDGLSNTKVSRADFIKDSIGWKNSNGEAAGYFRSMDVVGRRLLVRKSDIAELVRPGNVTRAQWSSVSLEVDLGEWSLMSSGTIPKLSLDIAAVCSDLDSTGGFGFALLYFDSGSEKKITSDLEPFAEIWKREIRGPLLRQKVR